MFNFQALNCRTVTESPQCPETPCQISADNDCSIISLPERAENVDTPNATEHATPKTKLIQESILHRRLDLSPSIVELLKPKKPITRESEEVRLLKLYRCALTMYSDDRENHDMTVKPVLESIASSFLLKSDNLPLQLKFVKIATYKLLGDIYLKTCQYEKATRIFLKATHLDPSDLNVWLRLARSAVYCGRFETITLALDRILMERPNHPLALRLSLPVYFAMSEFEICLKLCLRCLTMDSGNEQAIYYLQRITAFQPSLSWLLEDLCESRPDLLTETISAESHALAQVEANKLRSVYRKKMDVEAESRQVKTIDFPLPAGKLTWCSLVDTVLDLFDKLLKETTLACILNFEALLAANQLNCKKFDPEQQQQSMEPKANEVMVDSKSPDQTPEKDVVSEEGQAMSVDTLPTENRLSMERPELKEEGNLASAEMSTPQVENGNNQNEDGAEKRRSSRARQSIDLAETPSRNRARRSIAADSEPKVHENHCSTPKHCGNDRTKLIIAVQAILPKLYRDLAEHYTVVSSQNDYLQPPNSQTALSSNGERREEPQMPPESVADFLLLCQDQKPNIVSLGIALMLTISQMNSHAWSNELAKCYLLLFTHLKDSLPYHYLWPSQGLANGIMEGKENATSSPLPVDMLFLRRQPSIPVLFRLHCTYVELHLEMLDHQIHFEKEYCVTPSMETHFHILRPLFDIFALYEPDSPNYVDVQIHRCWIGYLNSSLVDDFTAMQTYLKMIKEILVENGITVRRNYSTLHGDLSEGFIDHLLNRVENASNVERLTKLADVHCHPQVVAEISVLLQRRSANSREADCGSRLTQIPVLRLSAVMDCVNLLHTSLTSMVQQLWDEEGTIAVGERQGRVVVCYQGAVLLLDQVMSLLPRDSSSTLLQPTGEDTCNLAVEALHLLCNTWELVMEYCTTANGLHADRVCECTDLSTVTLTPLRLDPPGECLPSGGHADDIQVTLSITVGAACKGLSTMLDFLTWYLRSSWKTFSLMAVLFSRHVISCVYEHLACLEQTIPLCLLPEKLRVYQSEWLTLPDSTSCVLLHSASAGTLAAPPSLLWLHCAHQIFNLSLTVYHQETWYTRLLPLLRQTLVRCSELLDQLTSVDTGGHGNPTDNDDEEEEKDTSGLTTSSQGGKEEAVAVGSGSPAAPLLDEDTIACVSDHPVAEKTVHYYWPSRCASLVEVLAQAVRCLLPTAMFGQITPVDELAVSGSPKDDMRQRVRERPCTEVLPRWLVTLRRVCSEDDSQHVCHLDGPSAWWSIADESATQDSEIEKANARAIDWQCIQVIFNVCRPVDLPEYDSIRTLSVSAEFSSLLLETTKLLPKDEGDRLLSDCQVEVMLQTKSNGVLDLPEEPKHTCLLTKQLFYLIADYYMKNNQFALAVDYYQRDLSVCPWRADTWAALALIYHSDLDQILNLTNLKTERVNPDSVSRCLRCFDVALSLLPNSITLLIERGCLAYQLHSYATRIVKKLNKKTAITFFVSQLLQLNCHPIAVHQVAIAALVSLHLTRPLAMIFYPISCTEIQSVYRSYAEAHVTLCRTWRHVMLEVSRKSYDQVLQSLTKPTQSDDLADNLDDLCSGDFVMTPSQVVNGVGDERKSTSNKLRDKRSSHRQQEREEEEEWLCHYMLAKCASKETRLRQEAEQPNGVSGTQLSAGQLTVSVNRLLSVLKRYKQALDALDLAGAKYPKKIIVYHKLPCRSVEAVEVYYAIHAVCLKFLLDHHSSATAVESFPRQDEATACLIGLRDFLAEVNECSFITSVSKVRRPAKKRIALTAGVFTEPLVGTSAAPKCQKESETYATVLPDPVVKTCEPAAAHVCRPSQEDFIDLTEEGDCGANIPDGNRPTASVSLEMLWRNCFERCQSAMLTVLQRLPLHYKAMYRLADLYLRAPHISDTNRAVTMLLGSTDEQDKLPVGGLFKDRRQNNFFHGVWRIPTPDIDRSGNFAAHMYRSVYLTLSLLQTRGDWRHLMHIFHQLRKQPPEEKRGFLGEGDRIFLARRAFNLIQPTLLTWLQNVAESMESLLTSAEQGATNLTSHPPGLLSVETLTQIYRLHCIAYSRNCSLGTAGATPKTADSPGSPAAASVAAAAVSGYTEVIKLAYRLCPAFWDDHGPNASLQRVIQRCAELTMPARYSSSTTVQPRSDAPVPLSSTSNSSSVRVH